MRAVEASAACGRGTAPRTTAPPSTTARRSPERGVDAALVLFSRRSALVSLTAALSATLPSEAEDLAPASEIDAPSQVYFDLAVDRVPVGRVVVALYDDVPVGGQRFRDLAIGKSAVRYRATRFVKLTERYVLNSGVSSLSLDDSIDSEIAGGDSLEALLQELGERRHVHDAPGVVSLVLKAPDIRPSKKKLVAVNGKFKTVEEGGGVGPNGTAFVITTAPSPDLDASNLVVGHVVSGLDVVEDVRSLPTVKSNKGSLFFKAAKQFGDPRADVAEMSFGKPFNRVAVTSSGEISS